MEELLAALPQAAEIAGTSESPFQGVYRAACLSYLGRLEEARAALKHYLVEVAARLQEGETGQSTLVPALEAAVLVGDREVATVLSEKLDVISGGIVPVNPTCIARHLGAAAVLLGDRQKARTYYEQALAVAIKARFRPEIALTRLQMAELCLEAVTSPPGPLSVDGEGVAAAGGEVSALLHEALAHLDFCIPEFRTMKMQPALERALRLQERLTG